MDGVWRCADCLWAWADKNGESVFGIEPQCPNCGSTTSSWCDECAEYDDYDHSECGPNDSCTECGDEGSTRCDRHAGECTKCGKQLESALIYCSGCMPASMLAAEPIRGTEGALEYEDGLTVVVETTNLKEPEKKGKKA